jgi:hypothetical protein
MAQQLNDKDWLEKVTTAYKVYPYPNFQISGFISWLYKQYGILEKRDKE